MNTKERILAILEEHRGTAVSGQALAQAAGVSRTAVWKAMEQLRQDGHRIQGATNRGYMLAPDSGVLCRETVLPYITAQVALVTPGAVDSTNNVAKQLAQQGAPHGTVVLSHKQTAGRGRMGRRFESPEGGIYVSILLRPQLPAQEGVRLTLGACVGVCRAMEQAGGLQGRIKWVNDVYLEGKKVCGILTEAATSVENGMLEYVIVGVGVNYTEPPEGFPPALKDIAGSLYGPHRAPPLPRNRMAALLIDQLMDCLERPGGGHPGGRQPAGAVSRRQPGGPLQRRGLHTPPGISKNARPHGKKVKTGPMGAMRPDPTGQDRGGPRGLPFCFGAGF